MKEMWHRNDSKWTDCRLTPIEVYQGEKMLFLSDDDDDDDGDDDGSDVRFALDKHS